MALFRALDHLFSDAPASTVAIPAVQGLQLAAMAQAGPLLVVAPSTRRAEELTAELNEYLGAGQAGHFPPWETLPHERLSPKGDTVAARLAILHHLPRVVVTSVRGYIQPIVSAAVEARPIALELGSEFELPALVHSLVHFGFTRTDLVERRGDFALRGGILDLFPASLEHPIRIDFFGDEIEEIAYFNVTDQRTFAPVVGSIEILPVRELLLTPEISAAANEIAKKNPQMESIATKVAAGSYAEGMESMIAALNVPVRSLLGFLPISYQVVLLDSLRINSRAGDLIATNAEFLAAAWSNAAFGAMAPLDFAGAASGQGYLTLEELQAQCEQTGRARTHLDPFATEFEEGAQTGGYAAIPLYRGNTSALIEDIRKWRSHDFLTIFLAGGTGTVERFAQLFSNEGIPVSARNGFDSQLTRDLLYLSVGQITHGFVNEKYKTVVITEQDLSGQRTSSKDQNRMPSRRKKAIDPLELKAGDYVVHEQHGVGRYLELTSRTINGVAREYVVIEYAPSKRGQPGDRIYVPTDSLEQVTKYVGGEAPALHRIGGADWQNAKKKARKAVRQIAADLIKLYAARMSAPGFAFSPDTPWQRELEEAFAYVETADQLSTIEEVKQDMQARHPMDRVICGDVGYGKTEIAIRAAFKAVQDGKQVAVLVPTTLLVQQHLNTFQNRYIGFPIKVAGISRFNTAKENKEILAALERGELDVIIGTHRLLSKDVVFKDLGLVIIDEEQRFGVEHKEELKKTRANIDVLSMSATPIPRTLEMAITGIREMSNITTPPEERHPVLTYVGPFDEKQVQAAIHRELLRDGQIFYVHNRVESIDRIALRLKELVPDARVAVAHGQMSERELEDVILGFWEKDFDILVATTIIESGIDIPNANTLIVDRSDVFGLSQLHQLRGRVGRARERAYAYFLYPADKPLTEVAHDRLQTIAMNTDLGAGMQVALKDLEIRGAGNMLGGEQSGHIADVGFDLYMRMVGEAVAEFKSGVVPDDGEREDQTSIKVELPINAHLPEEYVDSDRLRLDLYRRLAEATSDSEVDALAAELLDRFGPPPAPAELLLSVAKLRIFAKSLKLREVIWMGKNLKLAPAKLPESMQIRVNRVYPGSIYKQSTAQLMVSTPSANPLSPAGNSAVSANGGDEEHAQDAQLLGWVHQVIRDLFVR